MPFLSLRFALGLLSAVTVALVASVTLSIALTSSFDALHKLGTKHAEALLQAADALDAAVTLSNRSPTALALRADAMEKLGHFDKALADLDRAVAAKPQDASLRHRRASLLKKLDRCPAAIRDFDAALSLRPGNASAMAERATCKLYQGRLLGAATDYITSWF